MMATMASKTVRVLDIPLSTNLSEFHDLAKRLSSKNPEHWFSAHWFSGRRLGEDNPIVSLFPQYDGLVGTISLPSRWHKLEALTKHGTKWTFDDKFNNVTVLSCPSEPALEYEPLLLNSS